MTTTISQAGPRLSPERLKILEDRLGSPLPAEFHAFLLSTNGGIPTPDHYRIEGHLDTPFSDVQTIFGVDTPAEHDNLENVLDDLRERIPPGFLPVGHSSTNDFVCVSLHNRDAGTMYFWDSWGESVPDESKRSGYSNLYFVADNFSVFLHSLASYEALAGDA
jgi:hypothetical protein